MRIERLWGILLLAPAVATCACFEGERLVQVNGDGSGTIVDTLLPGAQMKALADLAQADKSGDGKKKGDAAALAMGPGVTFLGEEKTPAGAFKSSYRFKDVNALKVDVSPGPDNDSGGGGSKPQPMTFHLVRSGDKATLTVSLPRPGRTGVSPPPAGAGGGEFAQGMWTMMK